MAIDNASKRASIPGIARPWMRSISPDATKPIGWRQSVGLSYAGMALTLVPFPAIFIEVVEQALTIPLTETSLAIPLTETALAILLTETPLTIPLTETALAVPLTETALTIPITEGT